MEFLELLYALYLRNLIMEFKDIISDLKKKTYKPVYFLMGEEPYFIDAISDHIENNVLAETEKDFNQTILYGGDVDLKTIIANAKRFPMMSEYQVVIVKEAQNIRELGGKGDMEEEGKLEDKKEDKAKSPFAAYVENPQKSTILVMCYKYKTLDKRKALTKAIAKHAVLFESKKIYDDKIPNWIMDYLKTKKYTIHPNACVMLSEYLGNDISKIVNELDKLMISIPAGTEITPDHVQKNIGISKEYNVFELQKALGQKDILKANRIVNYFGANTKDHPLVMTVTLLFGYFHKILTYHFLPDKSRDAAAKAMGVHPFFLGDYEKAARLYPAVKIKSVMSNLREYDLKSKGIGNATAEQGAMLKELVYKILH